MKKICPNSHSFAYLRQSISKWQSTLYKSRAFRLAILLLLIGILSGSCVTQKKCLQRFPPQRDTLKIVSTRDSIIYKGTTIFIKLPGATVIDSIIIPCPDPGPAYIPKKVCAETSLASACAWWSYPVIKLELIQKDTTIERRLDNALKESYFWKSEYERINVTPQPIIKKYIPGFYKFCTFVFLGLVLAFAGYITLKVLKFIR